MSTIDRTTKDTEVCGRSPCIRGLGILSLLASGASREEILEDYPYLEEDDITAALEYAARQTDHQVLRVA